MKNIIYLLIIFCALNACGQAEKGETNQPGISKENLAQEIKTLEDKLLQIQDATKDTASANGLVRKSELYVQHFPADSLSPYLLFRAGDVARGAGDAEKAVKLWDSVWRSYETHRMAPGSLFAQAFTLDAQLENKKEAERYYLKFLHKYPEHHLATEVKKLLKMVNKSPDELVRDFEKNVPKEE